MYYFEHEERKLAMSFARMLWIFDVGCKWSIHISPPVFRRSELGKSYSFGLSRILEKIAQEEYKRTVQSEWEDAKSDTVERRPSFHLSYLGLKSSEALMGMAGHRSIGGTSINMKLRAPNPYSFL